MKQAKMVALVVVVVLMVCASSARADGYDVVHGGYTLLMVSPGEGRVFPGGTEVEVTFRQGKQTYVLRGVVGEMVMEPDDQRVFLEWTWQKEPFPATSRLYLPLVSAS